MGAQQCRSLTQRREEAVPGAGGGQGGAGLGEQAPAGLGGVPAGHVGELRSGPWLRARRGDRLKDRVFDALSTAVGEERVYGVSICICISGAHFLSPRF